jgi:hypothetical protein
MVWLLYVLISASLYRVPRGGPGREKWQEWLGWDGPGSTGGRLIWACGTAGMLVYLTGSWWAMAAALYLWAAIVIAGGKWADYGPQPEANEGRNIQKMTLWGLVLLNPLYGFAYFGCYAQRDRLPRWGYVLSGWTKWAELICGAVTAASVGFVVGWLL